LYHRRPHTYKNDEAWEYVHESSFTSRYLKLHCLIPASKTKFRQKGFQTQCVQHHIYSTLTRQRQLSGRH
jgi:hypothetical protein